MFYPFLKQIHRKSFTFLSFFILPFYCIKKFSFEDFFPYCSKPEDKCLFLQIYYEETPKAQLTFGRCSNIKWNIIMFVCLTFVIFWYKKIHFIQFHTDLVRLFCSRNKDDGHLSMMVYHSVFQQLRLLF